MPKSSEQFNIYSKEKAQEEAQKIKDLVGEKSTKNDIECAEQIIDEENESREKELRALAKKMFRGCEIKFVPIEIENIPNFNTIRPTINKIVSALNGLGLYNPAKKNFPEENFSGDEYYHGKDHFYGKMNELLEDLIMERLEKIGIQSYDDFEKNLKGCTLTEQSLDGPMEEIMHLKSFPKNYRDRFFYFNAVYKYTQEHPEIKDGLPDLNRSFNVWEKEQVEKFGFQRPLVRVTRSWSLDLSAESEFPNPMPIEKYNPDHLELTLYPAYDYSAVRRVSSVSGTGAESPDGMRVDTSDALEEYTHTIELKWYSSLAVAAGKTREAIKKTNLKLASGESIVDLYEKFKKEEEQKQKQKEEKGSLKEYKFESFYRDIKNIDIFIIDGEGKFVKSAEERNKSEGLGGRADRSKGITRIEKLWENTPTGVAVTSYEVERNKAKTKISIKFKLEVVPPQGLSDAQKKRILREIEIILNKEKEAMPKIYGFDVVIDENLK